MDVYGYLHVYRFTKILIGIRPKLRVVGALLLWSPKPPSSLSSETKAAACSIPLRTEFQITTYIHKTKNKIIESLN